MDLIFTYFHEISQFMSLSHMQAAKAQKSLRIRGKSSAPYLLTAHIHIEGMKMKVHSLI